MLAKILEKYLKILVAFIYLCIYFYFLIYCGLVEHWCSLPREVVRSPFLAQKLAENG